MKYCFFLLIACIGISQVAAQIQPSLTSGQVTASSSQWLDFSMQVPPGMPSRAIITASLRQNGQEVWSGTTITFPLSQGLMQIQKGQLPWATQQGEKPVAGPALFCIQILGNPGNQYLGEGCVQLEIRPDQVAAPGRVKDTEYNPDSVEANRNSPLRNNALPGVATKIRPTGSLEPYRQIANQRIPLTEFPTSPEGAPYQSEG